MEKVTEPMKEALKKSLDPKAIGKHPKHENLSSIKPAFVFERLNEVFGHGSWQTKVERVDGGMDGMVVVKVLFTIPEYGISHECFGGNDNGGLEGDFDLGDAYKGATTDAITKIASYLGIGLDVYKGETVSRSVVSLVGKEELLGWQEQLDGCETLEAVDNLFRANKPTKKQILELFKKRKNTLSQQQLEFNDTKAKEVKQPDDIVVARMRSQQLKKAY